MTDEPSDREQAILGVLDDKNDRTETLITDREWLAEADDAVTESFCQQGARIVRDLVARLTEALERAERAERERDRAQRDFEETDEALNHWTERAKTAETRWRACEADAKLADERYAHFRAERDAALARVAKLEAALREAKREHYSCEDCWYSCPKSTDGCCDETQGSGCNCGVEAFNACIDALLAESTTPTTESEHGR